MFVRWLAMLLALWSCSSSSSPPSVAPEQRAAIEHAVIDLLVEQHAEPAELQIVAVAELLGRFPELDAIAYDDHRLVSARYVDGMPLLVGLNRSPATAPSTAAAAHAAAVFPGGARAALFTSLGTCFDGGVAAVAADLRQHGYDVSARAGTVDDWLGLGDTALLHVNSHGGTYFGDDADGARGLHLVRGREPPPEIFMIVTASDTTPALDAQLEPRIRAGSIGHAIFPHDTATAPDGTTFCAPAAHYTITSKLVEGLQLAPNAFVFANACESADDRFRLAAMTAGATVYGGWSAEVKDAVAASAQLHTYQALLGAGASAPSSIAEVPAVLRASAAELDPSTGARVAFSSLQQEYLLVPAIADASVRDGQNMTKLVRLAGRFGATPGTVVIDGTDMATPTPWNTASLELAWPTVPSTLQVVVDNRRSNVLRLGGTPIMNGSWLGTHGSVDRPAIPAMREAGTAELYVRDLSGTTATLSIYLYFTVDFFGGLKLLANGGTVQVTASGITATEMRVRGAAGFDVAAASVSLTLSPGGTMLSGTMTMAEIPGASTYADATTALSFAAFTPLPP